MEHAFSLRQRPHLRGKWQLVVEVAARLKIRQGVGRFVELTREVGLAGAVAYALQVRLYAILRCFGFHPEKRLLRLRARTAGYPLYARDLSSDLEVFEQIFVKKEYWPLNDIADPKVIIDCGAYVGYSAAYFLTRFPHARLIAIEPD